MGSGENIWAFLVGLAALAGWTLSRFTVPGWANVPGGLGILPRSFSTLSLDDDGFQQELICPSTSSVRSSARTRVAARRSLSDSAINALSKSRRSIRVPNTSRWFVVDQPHGSTGTSALQSQSTPSIQFI
jgi:hypothetical protein